MIEALENAGIDYMITGSIASSLQGEPRSTHDLDVVVAIRQEDVEEPLRAFPPPEFYAEEGAVREAIRTEDTILAKLRWSKLSGGSEKYYLDALRVYEVQAGTLDKAYLEAWADRLEVNALWERIQGEAEEV